MPTRSLVRSACAVGSVALLSAAPAQDQNPSPIFRAGTSLARLDVRVVDARGQAITDLRPDELEIVDGGARRPILLFQRIAESGRSYVESGARTIASEISTNAGSPRGQLYLLLFDQTHITPGLETRARIAAETFLRRRVRPQDRVAVYGLPGPGPSLSFTTSGGAAMEALQRVRGQMERTAATPIGELTQYQAYEIARGNETEIERQIAAVSQRAPELSFATNDTIGGRSTPPPATSIRQVLVDTARTVANQTDAESRRFLSLATSLLRQVRAIDGQKTVVLFSEGFYADQLAQELGTVVTAAAESHAVVYAFDLNHSTATLAATSTAAPTSSETANRLEPLSHLANETNGALVIDALSDIDAAFARLADTSADFYMVGFEPASPSADDEYRRVEVRVRRPGARVSTRTGYAINTAATSADRRRALDDALTAPFGQQGLRVSYTTYVSRSDALNVARVALSLESELPVDAAGAGDADVVFVVREAETGQTVASGSDRVRLPAAPALGLAVGRGEWRVQFMLPPGSYFMRCVVREPGGLIGSADRRFQVRSFGGPDPTASDLLIGRSGAPLPVRAVGYADEPFSAAVQVYGRVSDDLAHVTGTIELVPADGGPPALTVRAVPGDLRIVANAASRELAFPIPLGGIASGGYVARALIQDGTSTIADLRREITVMAGPAPAIAAPAAAIANGLRAEDAARGAVAREVIDRAAHAASPALRSAASQAMAAQWSDALTTLLTVPPSDQVGAALRGVALLAERRFEESAQALAGGAGSADAPRAFLLGWARAGTADVRGAIDAFRAAAAANPSLVPAHLALAEMLVRSGDTAGASQALQDGLRAVPGSPELTAMLARITR